MGSSSVAFKLAMPNFSHSGDYGDVVYALPAIRALGGGGIKLGAGPVGVFYPMTREHYEVIAPLIAAQPYITSVEFGLPDETTHHNLDRFRLYLQERVNLSIGHLRMLDLPESECDTKWLSVPSVKPLPEGRSVVFSRSFHYITYNFPWGKLVREHRDRAVFVGLPEEYKAFTNQFDCEDIPYAETKDLLEAAQFIAGCELFIGNQSCPYSIAEGLKVNSLVEVWPPGPNCLFKRTNARYIVDPR